VNGGPVERDCRNGIGYCGLYHRYILNTPKRVSFCGAFIAADMPIPSTDRVSTGSMIPSSQRRAVL
jgi:hypothetical protein